MAEYSIKYSRLLTRLNATRRKETTILFLAGLLKTLAFSLCLIFFFSIIEMLANGDETFRGALALLFFAGVLTFALLFLTASLLRGFGIKYLPSYEKIALRIGELYPDIKDKLCNAIQLISEIKKSRGTSEQLAVAAFEETSNSTAQKNFDAIIEKKDINRSALFFFAALIISSLLIGIFPSSIGASLERIINWNKSYLPPAPFKLSIEPKFKTVKRGQPAVIIVKSSGKAPEKISLHIREEQQENFDDYTLIPDSTGKYYYEIPSLRETIIFYADAEWLSTKVKTGEGKIKVVDLPATRTISGRIIYPSYTKLAPRNFDEQTADISALKGSNVELEILANKKLKSAAVIFETPNSNIQATDSNSISIVQTKMQLKVDGRKARGSFPVTKSCNYYITITDENGQNNIDPIHYGIIAMNDEFPSISLLEPTSDIQVNKDAILPMKIAISDDYGFSSLKLYYRLAESRYAQPDDNFKAINILLYSPELTAEIPYIWDLNDVNISPSDRFEFYYEILDNDIISGPKSARTQILSVRLPSLNEVLTKTDDQQAKAEKELEKVLKNAEEVKKDVEDLKRELLKKQEQETIDWKDKKKAQDILKKQEELQQKISEIQKNLENITEQLRQNNAISEETLQKYMELQKLLQEVDSPELKRLQNQMQRVSPEDMQKAMKQVEFNEEKFRKGIERTLKILKRLKAEQKVDALTKRAEELQEKQEELQKQLENANPNDQQKKDEAAAQQKNMQEDLDNIQKELKELEELMKEIGSEMPLDELKKAMEALDKNETSQQMQEAQNSCKSGNFNKAQKAQKKASSNLKKFAEQMKQLKKEMQKRGMEEAIRQMQKSISDLLKLSEKQEALKAQTKLSDYNSTQFPQLAQQQAQLNEALANIANNMMALAQKSFAITPQMGKQIGDALQEMQNAIRSLSERQPSAAGQSQGNAMSSMNQAIMNMQAMLSQMQNSGSCSNPGGQGMGQNQGMENFMQQLQQLAQQQQGINQILKKLGEKGEGSLSPEEQRQLSRIAAQQGVVQEKVQELAQQQKNSMKSNKMGLGDLDKIAEEMKESIREIKSGEINPRTLKRQERILSRLLDASKSIHERDQEKRRESQTGEDVFRQSPGEIDLRTQEGRNRAMEELLRSIQEGYTKDYEALIRKYFEALQSSDGGKER